MNGLMKFASLGFALLLSACAALLVQYAAVAGAFRVVGRSVPLDWVFILVPLRAAAQGHASRER
mgnify:CR=1 FL=1